VWNSVEPAEKITWSVPTEKEQSGVKTQEVAADVVRGKNSNVGKEKRMIPRGVYENCNVLHERMGKRRVGVAVMFFDV
jgi:hypothetical protein